MTAYRRGGSCVKMMLCVPAAALSATPTRRPLSFRSPISVECSMAAVNPSELSYSPIMIAPELDRTPSITTLRSLAREEGAEAAVMPPAFARPIRSPAELPPQGVITQAADSTPARMMSFNAMTLLPDRACEDRSDRGGESAGRGAAHGARQEIADGITGEAAGSGSASARSGAALFVALG